MPSGWLFCVSERGGVAPIPSSTARKRVPPGFPDLPPCVRAGRAIPLPAGRYLTEIPRSLALGLAGLHAQPLFTGRETDQETGQEIGRRLSAGSGELGRADS